MMGPWESQWEGSPCGTQPSVCSSICCLGNLGCPSQFLRWLIPTAALCDSLRLRDDLGMAAEGEMGPLGRRNSGAR